MDAYPTDLLDGVAPLIFVVDTILNLNNDGGVAKGLHMHGRSPAFEKFFQRIAGRSNVTNTLNKDVNPASTPSQQRQDLDPLSTVLAIDPQKLGTNQTNSTLNSPNRATKRSFFNTHRSKKSAADFFRNSRLAPVSHRHSFPPSKDPHGNNNVISKLNQQLGSMSSSRHLQNRAVLRVFQQNPIPGILPSGWLEKHLHALPSTLIFVTELHLENTMFEQAKMEQHLANTLDTLNGSCAKKRDCAIHLVCLVKTSGRGPVAPSPAEVERLASMRSICRLGSNSVTAVHYFEKDGNGNVTTSFFESELLSLQKAVRDESMLYYLTQVRRSKRKLSMLHHEKYVDLLPIAARYSIKIAIFYEFQSCCDDSRSAKSTKYWTQAYKFVSEYYRHLQRLCLESGKSQLRMGAKKNALRQSNSIRDAAFDHERTLESTQLVSKYSLDTSDDGVPQTPKLDAPPPPPPPEEEGGVEVAINYSPRAGTDGVTIGAKTPNGRKKSEKDDDTATTVNEEYGVSQTHSKDMIHQCRGVADWINLKLLLQAHSSSMNALYSSQLDSNSGIGSDEFDGDANFSSLVSQIRKHCQVFLSRPCSLTKEGEDKLDDDKDVFDPVWNYWYYVSQQRLVLSQFLERHSIPLSAKEDLNHEALVYSSTAKQYALAGEASLKMSYAIVLEKRRAVKLNNGEQKTGSTSDDKQRFVGGLSAFDLESKFQEECRRDHTALALGYLNLALDLIKNEAGITEVDPLCARLNFLIGGLLMRKEQYESAIDSFDSALAATEKFPSLKIAIEKALMQCWKKIQFIGVKNPSDVSISSTAISQLFNPNTSALIDKRKYLGCMSSWVLGKETRIEWPFGQEDSQPIEFSFTFPRGRIATEGDVVRSRISLCSNLDFPVDLLDIRINSNIGTVTVDKMKGKLCPNQIFESEAAIFLPKNLSKIVNPLLLERQTVKGNRLKSSGFTMSGGVNYEPDSNSDLRFGGLCVFCDFIEIKVALHEQGKAVTLKMPNVHRGSLPPPGLKQLPPRVSIEEDNYVFSAWERSRSFSLRSGPRCLRVLTPTPDIEVSDLTAMATGGKAMEGTVNRIVLRIKAGPYSQCKDLKMNVTCSSSILREMSKETSIMDNETEKEGVISRPPLLVREEETIAPAIETVASSVPPGWCINGNGEGSDEEWSNVASFLGSGEDVNTFFNLYRQLPLPANEVTANSPCETKFVVRVSYKQIRPSQGSEASGGDLVVQHYIGSIVWCPPLKSSISLVSGLNKSFPSGIRHNSNTSSNLEGFLDSNVVIDGENVTVRCGLKATAAENGFALTLNRVSFESDKEEEKLGCDINLVAGQSQTQSNTLFSPKQNDICHNLKQDSMFNVTFSVRPKIRNMNFESESAQYCTSRLGFIVVEWVPIPIVFTGTISPIIDKGQYGGFHGPLPIQNLASIHLCCPLCYIEATPFAASLTNIPAMPKVTQPFEVHYQISNHTSLHQRLRVAMSETDNPVDSDGILVSGLINGDMVLGPRENKIFSYTLLVTKVGKTALPSLAVSSTRYKTWVINDKQVNIFVTP